MNGTSMPPWGSAPKGMCFALIVDGGNVPKKYATLGSDDAILRHIIEQLDHMFEGRASATYLKHIVQNWSNKPFIRGTYSHRKASVRRLAAPLNGKVYFAGEAMKLNGNTIAVHGADESSYLALMQMIRDHQRLNSRASAQACYCFGRR